GGARNASASKHVAAQALTDPSLEVVARSQRPIVRKSPFDRRCNGSMPAPRSPAYPLQTGNNTPQGLIPGADPVVRRKQASNRDRGSPQFEAAAPGRTPMCSPMAS